LWFISNSGDLLHLVGRNATLTGRVRLWANLSTMIQLHPWLGYGFNGFWAPQGPSTAIWKTITWTPMRAHNGYLDICLDLGIVGLAVFFALAAVTVMRVLKQLRVATSFVNLWPLVFVVFMLGYNLAESALMKQNNLIWALFVSCLFTSLNQFKEVSEENA
jgi:O-antigen ligase